ncbi:MAG: protein kinase [Planctomycetota bacterium]|nr:protein kinase [Planctomycetota bacterium]
MNDPPPGARRDGDCTSSLAFSFAGLTDFGEAAVEASVDPLAAGTRLGDVSIIRFIAAGGMGRVYEGLQGMPCRTVAVKLIHPGMLSPAAARRFEHEAHILGRLSHPGIAKIFSVGMQDVAGCPLPYFVMEFIEQAQGITAYAADRSLDTRQRVELFREVCRAVAHGHHKGIIHRDLKPGNILVDTAGQPKIIDFGVARSTDGDLALTTMHTDAGHVVGTLQYMSPEQFAGNTDEIDLRSDVYSLGIVLYELLAGRLPYAIANRPIHEAARIIRETEPSSITAAHRRFPKDLARIVSTCLEKDCSRRYSSAAELEADLGRFLSGEPIQAQPPGLFDTMAKLARRHRFAATTAAGVAISLVLALVGISLFAVRAEQQRLIAIEQRERADAASARATDHLYVANLRALTKAIQTGEAHVAKEAYEENATIVGEPLPLEMRCLAAGLDEALAVLDLGQGGIRDVAFNPNGSVLLARSFVVAPLQEKPLPAPFVAVRGFAEDSIRRATHLFSVGSDSAYQPLTGCGDPWVCRWQTGLDSESRSSDKADSTVAVSSDGRRVAVQKLAGIEVIDGVTGGSVTVVKTGRGRLQAAAFSPDGSRLFTREPSGVATLWDADDGRAIASYDEGSTEAFRFSPDGRRLALLVCKDVDTQRTDSQGGAVLCDVMLWETHDGRRLPSITLQIGMGFVDTPVEFSPDGAWLATSSRENVITIWSVADGTVVAHLTEVDGIVTAISFSPDGGRIAGGTQNGDVSLWDSRKGMLLGTRFGHAAAVTSLAFHPDGLTIASGSRDGTVRIWDATDGRPQAEFPSVADATAVCFRPDGRQIALAPQGTGRVELWNPQTMERGAVLDARGGRVNAIAYSADGCHVAAACGWDDKVGEVCVWDAAGGGRCLARLGDHAGGASTVAFNADGTRILTRSGGRAANIMLWNWRAGDRLLNETIPLHARFCADGDSFVAAVFAVDGSRVVAGKAEAWDAADGQTVNQLPPIGLVTALAAGPGGLVARGTAMGTVYVDDCQKGGRVSRLVGHVRSILDIAFMPDGERVVTASDDGTARIWETATGREMHVLRAHNGAVEKVLHTPDGRRIITASPDGTVRIWHASSGRELISLPGSRETPRAIALDPTGTRLVTAAHGGVRIWGLANAAIISARQAAAARDAAAPRAFPETPPDRPDPAD